MVADTSVMLTSASLRLFTTLWEESFKSEELLALCAEDSASGLFFLQMPVIAWGFAGVTLKGLRESKGVAVADLTCNGLNG